MMETSRLRLELQAKYPYMGIPPIEIPRGWFDLLRQFLAEVDRRLTGEEKEYVEFIEIKEKYGTLRVVDNLNTIDDLTLKIEDMSEHVCMICGEPGRMREDGWISVFCDEHVR